MDSGCSETRGGIRCDHGRLPLTPTPTPFLNPKYFVSNSVQTVKDLAKQRQNCEASIARVYSEYLRGTENVHSPPPVSLDTRCVSTQFCKGYVDTNRWLSSSLRRMTRQEYNGVDIDVSLWTVHKRAKISGVGFTSGQPMEGVRRAGEKMNRCSSVITLIRGGRSLYAWVIRFLSFDRIHVAHVRWLPAPEYPTGNPLVVRLNTGHPPPDQPCIVSLQDIDPSKVSISLENEYIYVIRMSGVDTTPT